MTATLVVVLNVDLAGPAVNVYSPRTSAVFPPGTPAVVVKGSAVDVLSGASAVTCAGVPATLAGQNFSCEVPVHDGSNSIQVLAFDRAGRTTAKDVPALVADVAAASLAVSPVALTLAAGASQPLAVVDDRGRAVTAGTWSTSNAGIAMVSVEAGVPVVSALSSGTATLTASPTTVAPSGVVTAAWSGIVAPTPTDWMGLFVPGASDGAYRAWLYVSCSQSPGAARAAGACAIPLPSGVGPGTYELRLFASNGFARLATSSPTPAKQAAPRVTSVTNAGRLVLSVPRP